MWLNILILGPSFFPPLPSSSSAFFSSSFLSFFFLASLVFLLLINHLQQLVKEAMHLPSCLLQLNLTSWQWWLKKLYSLILFPSSEVSNFQISGQYFPWYLGGPLTILNPLFQSSHRSLYLKIIANWKLKDMFICDINRAPKGEPDAQMSSFFFNQLFFFLWRCMSSKQQTESFIFKWLPWS